MLAPMGSFPPAVDRVEPLDTNPRTRTWGPADQVIEGLGEPDFMASQAGNFGDPAEGYGGCFGDDPAAYAAILREGYEAVKGADSSATVVFGSVAYDRFFDNPLYPAQNQGPFRYLFIRDALNEVAGPREPKPAYGAFSTFADVIGDATWDARISTGDPVVDGYRVVLADGRHAVVLFTDHGDRLGHRGLTDPQRVLAVNAAMLPGWTGTVRITDYLGVSSTANGGSIPVNVTHRPTYVEVIP